MRVLSLTHIPVLLPCPLLWLPETPKVKFQLVCWTRDIIKSILKHNHRYPWLECKHNHCLWIIDYKNMGRYFMVQGNIVKLIKKKKKALNIKWILIKLFLLWTPDNLLKLQHCLVHQIMLFKVIPKWCLTHNGVLLVDSSIKRHFLWYFIKNNLSSIKMNFHRPLVSKSHTIRDCFAFEKVYFYERKYMRAEKMMDGWMD